MKNLVGITGVTGFIGFRIFSYLQENQFNIRVFARNQNKLKNLGIEKNHNVDIVIGDLNDKIKLQQFCNGLSTLIHCAALIAAVSKTHYQQSNAIGTENIVNAVLHNQVKKLIFISSIAAKKPELGAYAMTKKQSEQYINKIQNIKQKCNTVILRLPTVYGPGDPVSFNLFKSAKKIGWLIVPNTKNSRYSMIFVDDVALLIKKIILQKNSFSGVFEIDDGKENGYKWIDIRNICRKIMNKNIRILYLPKSLIYVFALFSSAICTILSIKPLLPIDKARIYFAGDWICENKKICQYIDWKPVVKPEIGFKTTLKWYEKNRWL